MKPYKMVVVLLLCLWSITSKMGTAGVLSTQPCKDYYVTNGCTLVITLAAASCSSCATAVGALACISCLGNGTTAAGKVQDCWDLAKACGDSLIVNVPTAPLRCYATSTVTCNDCCLTADKDHCIHGHTDCINRCGGHNPFTGCSHYQKLHCMQVKQNCFRIPNPICVASCNAASSTP